jgi:four helix bundle protein
MRSHVDLTLYQVSLDFVEEIYSITKKFPQSELFILTAQMRKAAISIPFNIAEGAARNSNKDFIRFLYISLGSLSEIETQIRIANRLGYIEDYNFGKTIYIRKMILGLINSLQL